MSSTRKIIVLALLIGSLPAAMTCVYIPACEVYGFKSQLDIYDVELIVEVTGPIRLVFPDAVLSFLPISSSHGGSLSWGFRLRWIAFTLVNIAFWFGAMVGVWKTIGLQRRSFLRIK